MIDAHTHLERGPLTLEYVKEFVDSAIKNNIDTLHILDHTHRFIEFKPIYENYRFLHEQDNWLNGDNKFTDSIQDYIKLIEECKKISFPIEVKFGLEVCYQDAEKEKIKQLLSNYQYDFVIGSIHAVDYRIFDCSFSKEVLWNVLPVDEIYKKYFEQEYSLIESDLFTQIGHPDQIKMLDIYPSYDLTPYYEEFAVLAKEHNINVEANTGSHYRYGHSDIGLNKDFLDILKKYDCKIITASDAHSPEDVGKLINKL